MSYYPDLIFAFDLYVQVGFHRSSLKEALSEAPRWIELCAMNFVCCGLRLGPFPLYCKILFC